MNAWLIKPVFLSSFLYLAIGLFVGLRIWRLGSPLDPVFDEVYFPVMANQYLSGQSFFDIHPPLGKLIIALGELIFGNSPIGWRVMPLLAGLSIIPAVYFTSIQIFGDRRAGLIAAFLVAIDGLFIVYSRVGLMDGFMILFGLLAVGMIWRHRRARLAGQQASGLLLLAGGLAGLALAVKWIGVGFLPLVAVTGFITLWQTRVNGAKAVDQEFRYDWLVWAVAFIVLPLMIYTLPFLANWQNNFWFEFFNWHRQSWGYNVNLKAEHPYASQWWSWPFMLRPIWFYYKNIEGSVVGVNAIGNPLVWWGSTVAVVYGLLLMSAAAVVKPAGRRPLVDAPAAAGTLFLLAGYAIFFLPWTVVGRVLFLYHYFASYLFALLLSAYWLSQGMETPVGRKVAIAVLVACLAIGLAFVPIWVAYPIDQAWFNRLMWLKSWI